MEGRRGRDRDAVIKMRSIGLFTVSFFLQFLWQKSAVGIRVRGIKLRFCSNLTPLLGSGRMRAEEHKEIYQVEPGIRVD